MAGGRSYSTTALASISSVNVTEEKKTGTILPDCLATAKQRVFTNYYYRILHINRIEDNYKQAYTNYKKYIGYRDSIVNEDSNKTISTNKNAARV